MCSPSHPLRQIVKKTIIAFLLVSFLPCILLLTQLSGMSIYHTKERREGQKGEERKREKGRKFQIAERMIFHWPSHGKE